jgi:hypothetical protein
MAAKRSSKAVTTLAAVNGPQQETAKLGERCSKARIHDRRLGVRQGVTAGRMVKRVSMMDNRAAKHGSPDE